MGHMNFYPFPNLTTKHYILRQLAPKDEKEIFILRSDERVLKYLGIPPANNLDEARQFISKINNGITNNEWIYWAIAYKKKTNLAGTICLWNFSTDRTSAELGFELLPDYFGKGIIQEVLPVVIKFGFHTLNLHCINGEVAPENYKSVALLKKHGFILKEGLNQTGHHSGQSPNTVIYTLLDK